MVATLPGWLNIYHRAIRCNRLLAERANPGPPATIAATPSPKSQHHQAKESQAEAETIGDALDRGEPAQDCCGFLLQDRPALPALVIIVGDAGRGLGHRGTVGAEIEAVAFQARSDAALITVPVAVGTVMIGTTRPTMARAPA